MADETDRSNVNDTTPKVPLQLSARQLEQLAEHVLRLMILDLRLDLAREGRTR